jgi:hypothetical protein
MYFAWVIAESFLDDGPTSHRHLSCPLWKRLSFTDRRSTQHLIAISFTHSMGFHSCSARFVKKIQDTFFAPLGMSYHNATNPQLHNHANGLTLQNVTRAVQNELLLCVCCIQNY